MSNVILSSRAKEYAKSSGEEIYLYFKSYEEYKKASTIYWDRFHSNKANMMWSGESHLDSFLKKHKISRADYEYSQAKYRSFLKHRYKIPY